MSGGRARFERVRCGSSLGVHEVEPFAGHADLVEHELQPINGFAVTPPMCRVELGSGTQGREAPAEKIKLPGEVMPLFG